MTIYNDRITPEELERLTGDLKLVSAPPPRKQTRSERREAEKNLRSQVRRYHKITSGAEKAAVAKRRAKKKRAQKAQKVNRG